MKSKSIRKVALRIGRCVKYITRGERNKVEQCEVMGLKQILSICLGIFISTATRSGHE